MSKLVECVWTLILENARFKFRAIEGLRVKRNLSISPL